MIDFRVTQEGARWVARFRYDFETKEFIKGLGFQWDPSNRYWWTADQQTALRADPRTAVQAKAAAERAAQASRAVETAITVPAPAGLAYLPYQLAGINYAASRINTLIADEMGLGKTIQAVGVINTDPAIKRVLVICPATLKINWSRELTKWLVRPLTVGIAYGDHLPDTEVVIANFDIITRLRTQIDARVWDLLIVDEAHFVKNPKAQRTRAIIGHRTRNNPAKNDPGIKANRRLFLTGTPIVNRPAELWTLVEALDPTGLGANFFKFMSRYTNAHHNGYGWDFTGATNLGELQNRMRSRFMVRRLKAEVLKELPAKRRQVITVGANGSAAVVAAEMEVFNRHEREVTAARAAVERASGAEYEAAVRRLRDAKKIAFEEMSKVRHATAVAKIPHLVEHVTECLENVEKVVVFCHHMDVIDALAEAFGGRLNRANIRQMDRSDQGVHQGQRVDHLVAGQRNQARRNARGTRNDRGWPEGTVAVVDGRTAVSDRTAEVDRFQHDPECKVFIGSIRAAGVGLTLTAASLVVFGELDWTPGNVSQAEDRLHRIGQQDSVLVQHLVFDNSVDSRMAHTIIDKQAVIDEALDTPAGPVDTHPIPEATPPAPEATPPASANTMPPVDTEIPF